MTTAPTSYPTLLRLPGAAAFFTAACTGRLGIAMTSLGLVWLVHGATGSYATAGVVTGALAIAEALVGPQVGRLVDARGQTRVVPVLVAAHAVAVAALVGAATAQASTVVLVIAALAAGASIPQLGALSAARWVDLLHRQPQGPARPALPAAFALESVANAGSYLAGPVLVSAVAASGHPALGSVTAAALVVTGGLAMAARRDSAPPAAALARSPARGVRDRSGRRRGWRGRVPRRTLFGGAFTVLVGVQLGMGAYFGATQVSVAAFAVEVGRPGAASALYGASSVAGLVAAWAYGHRVWGSPPHRQLAVAALVLAVCSAPLMLARDVVQMGLALAAAGAAVPVVLVLSSVLTQARVDRSVLTQAFTWLGSATAAGSAGAAALAGAAVDAAGARGGMAVALAATTVTAVLATSSGRRAPVPPRSEGR